jgi:hypothetical protein
MRRDVPVTADSSSSTCSGGAHRRRGPGGNPAAVHQGVLSSSGGARPGGPRRRGRRHRHRGPEHKGGHGSGAVSSGATSGVTERLHGVAVGRTRLSFHVTGPWRGDLRSDSERRYFSSTWRRPSCRRDHSRQLDAQCRASSAPLRDLLDAPTALAACCGFDLYHKYILYLYFAGGGLVVRLPVKGGFCSVCTSLCQPCPGDNLLNSLEHMFWPELGLNGIGSPNKFDSNDQRADPSS